MRPLTVLLGLGAAALLLAGCGSPQVVVQPFPAEGHWQPGLVGLTQYGPSGLGPTALASTAQASPTPSPSPSSSSSPSAPLDSVHTVLESVGLQQSDVLAGNVVTLVKDGASIDGHPTLDFCGLTYPSESLRTARRQVAAFSADGASQGLSTEAVLYSSPEAAAQAISEIAAARKACPDGTTVDRGGVQTTYNYHPAPGPSSVPIVAAPDRAVLHLTTTSAVDGGRHALLIFQRVGSIVEALYVSGPEAVPFEQNSLDRAFTLAGALADRMRAAPQPTTA